MKAKKIMSQPVVQATEETTLGEIATLMIDKRIGCVPIVDPKGEITGIVTESSFTGREKGVPFSTYTAPQLFGHWIGDKGVEKVFQEGRKMKAKEVMATPVITATEEDSLEEVVERMIEHDIHRVPIVRNKKPVGIVARHDLLRLMVKGSRKRSKKR